jgi:hypothetical protein
LVFDRQSTGGDGAIDATGGLVHVLFMVYGWLWKGLLQETIRRRRVEREYALFHRE